MNVTRCKRRVVYDVTIDGVNYQRWPGGVWVIRMGKWMEILEGSEEERELEKAFKRWRRGRALDGETINDG